MIHKLRLRKEHGIHQVCSNPIEVDNNVYAKYEKHLDNEFAESLMLIEDAMFSYEEPTNFDLVELMMMYDDNEEEFLNNNPEIVDLYTDLANRFHFDDVDAM